MCRSTTSSPPPSSTTSWPAAKRAKKKSPTISTSRPETALVALALGSNLGDREAQLRTAIAALSSILGPLEVGPLVRSAPLAGGDQPDYLNTVVLARTALAPEEVLAVAKRLELRAGRRAGGRWSSRPLDIDILLAGDHVVRRPELTLPHPELRRRGFVLVPLARLLPDLAVPPDGARVADLAAALPASARPVEIPWSRNLEP